MRILILDDDIFGHGGGGQTFYRKLICDHPDISFVYFARNEKMDNDRPANASVVLAQGEGILKIHQPIFYSSTEYHALRRALSYASAVSGQVFDIIDVPDYQLFGTSLRLALETENVQFSSIVHSMHGGISDSIQRDWASVGQASEDIRALERAQFLDADHRYAISTRYAAEWQDKFDRQVEIIDPISVVYQPDEVPDLSVSGLPSLLCVGRRERRKGNDIALEIAKWIDPKLYKELQHIGASSDAGNGRTSDDILAEMSSIRGISWVVEPSLSQKALFKKYQEPAILLVPTRYDTFNLVALEALLMGVPSMISTHAGICDYLDALPFEVPYAKINIDRPETAAATAAGWLADYSSVKQSFVEVAYKLRSLTKPMDVSSIYHNALKSCDDNRPGNYIKFDYRAISNDRQPDAHGPVNDILRLQLHKLRQKHPWAERLVTPYRALKRIKGAAYSVRNGLGRGQFKNISIKMNSMPENTKAALDHKLATACALSAHSPGRCDLWAELARLERLRGNHLMAAAYDIRVMRMQSEDVFTRLPAVTDTLCEKGLSDVSAALVTQFGPGSSGPGLSEFLQQRIDVLKSPPRQIDDVIERYEDHRATSTPKVSIIVSLYSTGEKLARFLALLSKQTLAVQEKIELIFIDAASPDNEWQSIQENITLYKERYLYIRTSRRITIQAAWNLALVNARAPYIACLGVDETIFPGALEKLADKLDTEQSVDWAMGSSIVTDVNMAGGLVRDKMIYDRGDAQQEYAYLDTTYVSWVGGLYRRSIHDRFGYYDEAFMAAGDTEFKMRVLPKIKVAFLPYKLGLFLDYPDARATAGVRAELEDALAWYVHRSAAGMALITAEMSTEKLEKLLHACAGRRKCYSTSISTDIELGCVISALLCDRPDRPAWAQPVHHFFRERLAELRRYDLVLSDDVKPGSPYRLRYDGRLHSASYEKLTGQGAYFQGLNDNRFEQHNWFWDTQD